MASTSNTNIPQFYTVPEVRAHRISPNTLDNLTWPVDITDEGRHNMTANIVAAAELGADRGAMMAQVQLKDANEYYKGVCEDVFERIRNIHESLREREDDLDKRIVELERREKKLDDTFDALHVDWEEKIDNLKGQLRKSEEKNGELKDELREQTVTS